MGKNWMDPAVITQSSSACRAPCLIPFPVLRYSIHTRRGLRRIFLGLDGCRMLGRSEHSMV